MIYFIDIITRIVPKLNSSITDDVRAVYELYLEGTVSGGTGFEAIPRFMLLSALIELGYKPQTKGEGPDVTVEGKPSIEVKSGFTFDRQGIWYIEEGLKYGCSCLYMVPDSVHSQIKSDPRVKLIDSCSAKGFTIGIIERANQ